MTPGSCKKCGGTKWRVNGQCSRCAIKYERERRAKIPGYYAGRYQRRIAAGNDRSLEYQKELYKNNKPKFTARDAARRSQEVCATPLWADKKAIAQVYVEAAWFTKETGIPRCVDHVVPLRGKNVCGLHVENNLRTLTQKENDAKGNKF